MAPTFKRLLQLSLTLLIMVFISCSCRKTSANKDGNNGNPGTDTSSNSNNGNPGGPVTTPIGSPIGSAQQIVVGTAGGIFTTEDERLTLEFPAGALSASTTITLQPVQNRCPGGAGNAYLITPHDLKFNHPVKLTFVYGDSDVVNSIPMGMTLAYQGTDGIWRTPGGMTKDTLNKKVTVLTDHFSSWSLFRAVELTPSSAVVEPGGSMPLYVSTYIDWSRDSLIPPSAALEKKQHSVKSWNLGGEGRLTPDNDNAVYLAPGSIPSRNPVAVSATLNTTGVEKFLLVSHLYIGNQGLTFRIDNGPWMTGGSDGAFFNNYNYEFIAANSTTPQPDGTTITWNGDTHLNEFVSWRRTWPSFLYGEQTNINYTQLLLPEGKASPGGIYFYQAFKTPATPFVNGTFTLEPAQKIVVDPRTPEFSKHRIEGFFKVKWQ
ncbi:MAG TPA: hypothetical protein VI233_13235 [Puia sp.]